MSEFASGQLFVRGSDDESVANTSSSTPGAAAAAASSLMASGGALSAAIRSPSLSSLKNLRDTFMRSDSQTSGTSSTTMMSAVVEDGTTAASNNDGTNENRGLPSPVKRRKPIGGSGESFLFI